VSSQKIGTVVVVTGTDTGVGKTIAVAALAVAARERGTVAVVKPVQTGIGPKHPDDPSDIDEIGRLTGCAAQEYTCLEDALAPDTAARLRGVTIPPVKEYADRIRVLAEVHDTVIVEGSGGLLVRLDTDGGTLLDIAAELAASPAEQLSVEVYVVARAGLGTLNHTELTVDALRARGLEPAGLVIGSWPADPGLAERQNADDLPRVTGVPVSWVLPEGVGALERDAFVAAAPGWREQ
jgi:dethiobiotin synthetase